MQDSNNLKQTLESEHKQTDPKPIDKKGQNKILIPLAIILVLIFIGLLVYIIYTYLEYKNKISTSLNTNNTNTQNTSTPNTTSTSTSAPIEPFEGWKVYENKDFLISELKYPSNLTPKFNNDDKTIYFKDDKNNTPLIIYQTESPIDSQEWCSNKGSVDYLETEVIPLDRNDYGYICLLDGNEEYYLQYYVPTVDIYINLEAGNSLGKEVFLDIINSIKLIDTTAIN